MALQDRPTKSDIAKAYKKTFSTADLVMADLKIFCHDDSPSFVQGDPHITSYHEGQRSVLNRIKYFLAINPKDLDANDNR